MAHALFRLALPATVFTLAISGSARSAPNALTISATASCRVALTKVSYDSPGADNGEFIELAVERFARAAPGIRGGSIEDSGKPDGHVPTPLCNTGHGPSDASSGTDGTADASGGVVPRVPTLSDCGLRELRLVNGDGGACDEYRVIPLASVDVPDDGYVVICAQDSVLRACDVTTAGRSALRNGFLQNGPNDGLRFVGATGLPVLEVSYEGGPSCFAPGASALVDETGEMTGNSAEDDVNVVCGDHFELRGKLEAPSRSANPCVSPAADAGDAARVGPRTFPLASTSPPNEFVPDAGAGYPPFSVPDAALVTPPKLAGAPMDPPSCRSSTKGRTTDASIVSALAPLLFLSIRRRKRRLRSWLRAGYFSRFGSAPRRSP